MHLDSKLNGNRISLQKLSKTFKQAEEFFYLVEKNKEHLFPFAYWELNLNSPEDCYERIVSQHDKWEDGTAYIYGIFENNTNKLIGNIFAGHFSLIDNSTELGYWIDIDYTGKGLMKEAVTILEQELFNKGIVKIIIKTDVENNISASVAKSLGYGLEGILKKDQFIYTYGELRDHNLFAKIKE